MPMWPTVTMSRSVLERLATLYLVLAFFLLSSFTISMVFISAHYYYYRQCYLTLSCDVPLVGVEVACDPPEEEGPGGTAAAGWEAYWGKREHAHG